MRRANDTKTPAVHFLPVSHRQSLLAHFLAAPKVKRMPCFQRRSGPSSKAALLLFALLLALHTQAVPILQIHDSCTGPNDGEESVYTYPAFPCVTIAQSLSFSVSCSQNTVKQYLTANCEGEPSGNFSTNECFSNFGSQKRRISCVEAADPEFARERVYSDEQCTTLAPLSTTVSFLRLNRCYVVANGGASIKYEKVNGNAFRLSQYTDTTCGTVGVSETSTAGVCNNGTIVSFVAPSELQSSAGNLGVSAFVTIILAAVLATLSFM